EHIHSVQGELHIWELRAQNRYEASFITDWKSRAASEGKRVIGKCDFRGVAWVIVTYVLDSTEVLVPKLLKPNEQAEVYFKNCLKSVKYPTFRGKTFQLRAKLKVTTMQSEKQGNNLVSWFPVQIFPPNSTRILPNEPSEKTDDTRPDEMSTHDLKVSPKTQLKNNCTNPFLPASEQSEDLELRRMSMQPERKEPVFARISDSNGEIAKMLLIRTDVKPGDILCGFLDFRSGTSVCTEYCVKLVAIEEVPDGIAPQMNKKKPNKSKTEESNYYGTVSEVVLGLDTTSFDMAIPPLATPTFSSNSIRLKWVLRFEFVITTKEYLLQFTKSKTTWRAPAKMHVKSRIWETELHVHSF
ncbi:hypothetical protein TCAL_15840, partial [Tigriopus californicus]